MDDDLHTYNNNKRMKFTHSNTLSSNSVIDQLSSHIPLDFHATSYDRSTDATAPELDLVDFKPVSLFHIKSRKTRRSHCVFYVTPVLGAA